MFGLFKKETKEQEITQETEQVIKPKRYQVTFVLDDRNIKTTITCSNDLDMEHFVRRYFMIGIILVGDNHYVNTKLINEINFKEV